MAGMGLFDQIRKWPLLALSGPFSDDLVPILVTHNHFNLCWGWALHQFK